MQVNGRCSVCIILKAPFLFITLRSLTSLVLIFRSPKMEISTEHTEFSVVEPAMHTPQHVALVPQQSPLSEQCNLFLTGYVDCMQEAYWFLTQVEKLPLDHPMVVGLKMKLYEQYEMLRLQYMLRNTLLMYNEVELNQNKTGIRSKDSDITKNVIGNDVNENVEKSAIWTETGSRTNSFSASTDCVPHAVEVPIVVQENSSNDSDDSELSPEAHGVALALADEIFSLLQGQGQDDFDESDDEEESIDEGFEELIEL